MATVISVFNQKGGTGKTTSVVSLSHAFAKKGYRVLAIDLDPQANSTISFNIGPGDFVNSIAKVLTDPSMSLASVIVPTRIKGIYCAPADPSLGSVDINLASAEDKQFRLKKKVDGLNAAYDYVFIDCPPSLGLLPINALTASRYVLIPLLAQYLALEGLRHMTVSVEKVKDELNPGLEILGILFCMVDTSLRMTQPGISLVRESFKKIVLKQVVKLCPSFDEAAVMKETIFEYAPESSGASDYSAVAAELLESLKTAPPNPFTSFFDRLRQEVLAWQSL